MSVREQILVVDNEPLICKSCKEILEDEGFLVDMAYSGEEGLKKGLEKKFDLVILDIRMPDISGMTLLETHPIPPGRSFPAGIPHPSLPPPVSPNEEKNWGWARQLLTCLPFFFLLFSS